MSSPGQYSTRVRKMLECMPLRQLDYSVHISKRFRYIYIETPKVACGSIKSLLQVLELGEDIAGAPSRPKTLVHDRTKSPLLSPSELGWDEFSMWMEDPDIYKFAFVRNPFTRTLSSFFSKMNQTYFINLLNPYLARPASEDNPPTLDQFLEAVARQSHLEMDSHWRTQYRQMLCGAIKHHFIGRFESLATDLNTILSEITGKTSEHFSLPHFGKGRVSTYDDLLSAARQRLIEEIYKEDFLHFPEYRID